MIVITIHQADGLRHTFEVHYPEQEVFNAFDQGYFIGQYPHPSYLPDSDRRKVAAIPWHSITAITWDDDEEPAE